MAYTSKIIILAGQSLGRGDVAMASLPAAQQGWLYKWKCWDGSTFVTMNCDDENNNQFGQAENTFGVEPFLRDYATGIGRDVYLLKYCFGSSCMKDTGTTNCWNTTSADEIHFTNLKTYITNVKTYMTNRDKLYNFDAVIWNQGECDGGNETDAGNYAANFLAFFNAINTHIGQVTDPIWVNHPLGGDVSEVSIPAAATMRATQKTIADTYARFNRTDTNDCTFQDGVHWDLATNQTQAARIKTILDANLT